MTTLLVLMVHYYMTTLLVLIEFENNAIYIYIYIYNYIYLVNVQDLKFFQTVFFLGIVSY